MYHKSQVLYGLDLARRDIAKGKQVVVVEGYTDVMACHLAGVTTAVATCGTSFGVDHIKVIRRVLGDVDNADTGGTGQVVFTFDPDEAGQKAASRAFQEEQRFAAQTYVAVAPDGLDPSDLRTQRGDEAVRTLIADRQPMFEFMLKRVLARFDLETVEGRVSAMRASAPVLAGIRDPALRSGYARNVAGWLGMDPAEVSRAVKGSSPRPVVDAAPGEPAAEKELSLLDLPTDIETRMERDALIAILQRPDAVGRELIERAATVRMRNSVLAAIRDGAAETLDGMERPDWVTKVAEVVPSRFAGLVAQLGVAPIPERESGVEKWAKAQVADLVAVDLGRRKFELQGASQRAAAEGDLERARRIQVELVELEKDRRRLTGR